MPDERGAILATYIYTHTHTYTLIHICMHICIYIYIYIYIYICINVYTCIHIGFFFKEAVGDLGEGEVAEERGAVARVHADRSLYIAYTSIRQRIYINI